MTFDDSDILVHRYDYDPVKAREYYLRTRKLKGRPKAAPKQTISRSTAVARPAPVARSGGKPNRADTKSRQAELRAQKKALQKRLERLREVLEELVDAAKKRSGGNPNKKDEKDKAPETQADKADRNKDEKSKKPLTAKQKREKAKKAKDAYEKEHPNTLSQDVEILREQVKDIQHKIEKAVAEARERRNKAGKDDKKSGPKVRNNHNDGPRGR